MTRHDADAATMAALRAENARLREQLAALGGGAVVRAEPEPLPVVRRSRSLAFALAFAAGVVAVLLGLRLLPADFTRGFLDGARGMPAADAPAAPSPPAPPSPPSPP